MDKSTSVETAVDKPISSKRKRTFLRRLLDLKDDEEIHAHQTVGLGAVTMTIVGLIVILVYARQHSAYFLMVALAALGAGTVSGFIFSVPRIIDVSISRRQAKEDEELPPYRINDNLVGVSDWVTKIVVGLGLINFRSIGPLLGDVGRTIGSAVPEQAGAAVFGVSSLVYFACIGFTFGYINTRLYLTKALYLSEYLFR